MQRFTAILAVVLSVTVITAQQASVTVKMNTYTGMYRPRNCVAIWVTDAANRFVKTLKINAKPQSQPGGFRHCLVKWISQANYNVVDAVTSASNAVQGTRTATWDCTDVYGNEVPDGDYRIYYEMTEANSYVYAWRGPWAYIQFTKGTQDAVVTGSDTWFKDGWTGNPNYGTSVKVFENAKVTYTAPAGNPGTIALTAAAATVNEDGGTVTVTAARTGGSQGAVSVACATANGTALAGQDYTVKNATLSWSDGQAGTRSFTVTITDDQADENNENFRITISSPAGGAVLGAQKTTTVTIVDNEGSVQDPDLLCHYDFDDNVLDASGHGNDGTLVNAPAYIPGRKGKGLQFNGVNQYVEGADIDFPSAPFSISAWFKTTVLGAGALLHKISVNTSQNYYLYPSTNGGAFCGLYDGNGWQEVSSGSGTLYNDGAWHHVAMVVDANTIEIYVDGVARNTGTHDNSFPTNNVKFNVGKQNNASNYYTGAVDELRIYKKVLSAAEVAALAADTGGTVTDPGVIQMAAPVYGAAENGGTVTVTAARSGGTQGAISVPYATADGTAAAGTDYTARNGTFSWTDGETGNKTAVITITDDTVVEGDETFTVSLGSPTGGAALGPQTSAVVTITDNDAVVADPDLLCHYTFDQNALDASGNGNDGTVVGGAPYVAGRKGNAVRLNGGSQYVNGADIDFPSAPFSITLWFRTASHGTGPAIHKISNSWNQNYYIYPATGGGALCGAYDGTGWQEVSTGTGALFNDTAWHHAAMVVTSGAIELFVDGTSYGTDTHDNSFPTNDQPFNVGKQNNASVYFDGELDELRIYKKALSGAELAALILADTAAATTLDSSLAAYWSFDGSSATVAADSSGNGNDGTISGAVRIAGRKGGALSFDGTASLVNAGQDASLAASGPVSVAAWVFPNKNGADMQIVHGGDQYILWVMSNNKVRFADVHGHYIDSPAGVLSPGVWTHVAGVFEGGSGTAVSTANAHLYINGTEVAGQVSGTWAPTATLDSPVYLGSNGTGDFWDGALDEVRVYTRALSAVEVAGLAVDTTVLVPDTTAPNLPPVAGAGPDMTIQLPVSMVTVFGQVADPDGEPTAFVWTQVSGPSAAVITTPTESFTDITGLAEGTYLFSFTVTDDDSASASDTMQVTVEPAPYVPNDAGPDTILFTAVRSAHYEWTDISYKPYAVWWVEDDAGNLVKILYLTEFENLVEGTSPVCGITGYGASLNYFRNRFGDEGCPTRAGERCSSCPTCPGGGDPVDGITGCSERNNTADSVEITRVWDMTDRDGNLITTGTYSLFYSAVFLDETTLNADKTFGMTVTLSPGGIDSLVTAPADIAGTSADDSFMMNSLRVQYGGHGTTGINAPAAPEAVSRFGVAPGTGGSAWTLYAAAPGPADIRVYSADGSELVAIRNVQLQAGANRLEDTPGMRAGVYLVRVTADGRTWTGRTVLLR